MDQKQSACKCCKDGIAVAPTLDELYPVQDYIHEVIGENRIPRIQKQKIDIIVDEIFSNIVKYSRAGQVQIICIADADQIRILFSDDGTPFNPLTANVSDAVTPRTASGMGISIIRKIMDLVQYEYRDNKNTLTITLNIKENEK